ncbi:hypothetical protein P8605_33110 [Streptomyces sp. T-3]|nr:hypothetical protein [Streptomyces sp. T-3]
MVDDTLQRPRARNIPAPRTWILPMLSTVVTLPAMLAAFYFVGLSPMACDSCDGAVLERFDASYYGTAAPVFLGGLLVPLGLLVISRVTATRERHKALRVICAVLAPLSVLANWILFQSLVEWPPNY